MATASLVGVQSLIAQSLELQTLSTLTNLRLSEYVETKSPAEKEKLALKIEDGISKITMREGGDGLTSLLLRGKLQRAQGKVFDAIPTLEHALALADQDPNAGSTIERWEITEVLARCYIETNQSGAHARSSRRRAQIRHLRTCTHFPRAAYDSPA